MYVTEGGDMRIRTVSDGDLEIVMEAKMKSPYPKLRREVSIDKEVADIVAVTSQLTVTKGDRVYKGYHAYILKDVTA